MAFFKRYIAFSKILAICKHYGMSAEDSTTYSVIHRVTDGGKRGIEIIKLGSEGDIDEFVSDYFNVPGLSYRDQRILQQIFSSSPSKRLFTDPAYREKKFNEYTQLIRPNLPRVSFLDVLRKNVGKKLPDLEDLEV